MPDQETSAPTPRGPLPREDDVYGSPEVIDPAVTMDPNDVAAFEPPPIRPSTGPVGYPPVPRVNTTAMRSAGAGNVSTPDARRSLPSPSFSPNDGQRREAVVTAPVFDDVEGPEDEYEPIYEPVDHDDGYHDDGRPPTERPRPRRFWMLAVGLLVILAGVAVLSRFRSGVDTAESPTVDVLARSTVQIVGLDGNGDPLCSGSGTLVSIEGMVLTNAHVVTPDAICNFSALGIAMTTDSGRPPDLLYRAELLATDTELDLAVITVGDPLDPDVDPLSSFPAMSLGDSDTLTIGDNIRILGYPEIGGETITFTNGSVSGFTAQAGIGDRALIKTDATIAGGNSGGAAVDAEGRLIGIPTKARASESGPAVDCRPLADTNNDGAVDDNDNCVPIGGFLNGLRPINLAKGLIEQATGASPQPLEAIRPEVEVDLDQVRMSRPRFSLGESDNAPVEVVRTARGGVAELCLFVDWAGIPDGAEWDGLWYYDKELVEDFSLARQSWEFGESGSNFWMCAIDSDNGLEAGLYELGFFLDGELVFAEAIVLTDEDVAVFATTWENITEVDICGLAINPVGSGPVGLNELDPDLVLAPGDSATIDLAGGEVVVEAYDCDGEVVADSGDGLEIIEERRYTIEAPSEDDAESGDVSNDETSADDTSTGDGAEDSDG
ncbi:MAG: serine protease [Actinomycetota bacterium]